MKIQVGQIWEANIPVRREITGIDTESIFFSVEGEQEEETRNEFARWIAKNNAESIEIDSEGEYKCEECGKQISKETYDMYDGCCKKCYAELNNF